MTNNQIGTNIKAIAKDRKKKLHELAKDIDVPATTLSRYIMGLHEPSYEKLKRICDSLNCKASDILGF